MRYLVPASFWQVSVSPEQDLLASGSNDVHAKPDGEQAWYTTI